MSKKPQKAKDAKRASIIIPTHNRLDDLEELLSALETTLEGDTLTEVIIVDDASSDGTCQKLQAAYPWVQLIASNENAGPAAARNVGARAASGMLLLFLDSDGVPEHNWLEAMMDAQEEGTVLLGCPVDYDTGRVQSVPRRATFLGKSLPCAPHRANSGPSCNLGIPRDSFRELGGFDEEIPYYFEDSDLCIRARRAGCAFKFVPDAVFRHKGMERKKGNAIRMQEHNSTYAMLKHYQISIPTIAIFIILNSMWFFARLFVWGIQGRFSDCKQLFLGWVSAHGRFAKRMKTSGSP